MIERPHWSLDQIKRACTESEVQFKNSRIREPLEAYLEFFDEYLGVFETLLERTVDLTTLRADAAELLPDPKFQEAIRYLMGPPISADDLKVVAEAASLNSSRLKSDPKLVGRVVQVILDGLDRRRFSWLSEEREALDMERQAAVVASAALIATRRLENARRNQGKQQQEGQVANQLKSIGLIEVARRHVSTYETAPRPGEFCLESQLGERKADFIVGLFDGRIMAIECKVSNSSTNSVKRLNNDAAAKAEAWIKDFGARQVVPCAVLGGVYKPHNVLSAQNRGLAILWAHDLYQLTDWIISTRPA